MLPDLFKRLKPLYGATMDRMWIEYQTADPARRREIEELLVFLAVKRLGIRLGNERIVLEPPSAKIIGEGDYTLGHVEYPGLAPFPVRVKRNELLRHVFILGPTGTGKSTLILSLIQQLVADDVPCWIIDFKRNYRCLLKSPFGNRVGVLTVGRSTAPLHVNVLRAPPGVASNEWIEALADLMSNAYLLMQGARNVLKDILTRTIQAHQEQATLWHAYRLIREDLRNTRVGSRRYGWLESAARTLEELSIGAFGEALNAMTAPSLASRLEATIVFETQQLGDDQKRFFCLYLLQYVLLLRKHREGRREMLHHVLCFDESQLVFPKDSFGTLSVPSRLAREIREYGEAIIAASQQSDVSESLIANAGFKIILRCDFPRDVEFASKVMQLDPKIFPRLPLGHAIVRFPVRHYQPFLFTFGSQPLKNVPVTDDEVRARVKRNSNHSPIGSLTAHDEALLQDIAFHPISGITQRYMRLGWNPKTGHATTRRLLAQQLITFEHVSTPTARLKILTLTVDGRAHLHEHGTTLPQRTKGGVEHEYWRHVLKERLEEKGYRVTEEYSLNAGQAVDLYATKNNKKLYIEIETGKSDIAANLKKCNGLPGTVIFFFTNNALSAKQEHWPTTLTRLTPQNLNNYNF